LPIAAHADIQQRPNGFESLRQLALTTLAVASQNIT
jgi:hypothetical protein